jgi:branched-subunit amino acid aminotransferase/4-amino-4-deoxychorismate lyase
MIGFNNGTFQKVSQITIPITSLSINRGYGAYDFFEVINNKPFYGDRHIARFKQSLKLLKLKIAFENELESLLSKLIELNALSDFYVKIFALPHEADNPEYYSSSLYMFPTLMPELADDVYAKGAQLILKSHERFLSEAKSTNYLFGQYLQHEVNQCNAIDVLYHSENGILETSRGNIFIVKNGKVLTPGANVLKGVTRSVVLDILKKASIHYTEKEISLNELYNADEVFVTSTTKLVIPIVGVGGKPIGLGIPGDITQGVLHDFIKLKNEFRKRNLD